MDDHPLLLTEVRLERFKAAFKPRPIGVFPFTVIVGRNGSGKSTLLEALQWLDKALRRDAREASDRYFGVRDLVNLRSQSDTPYFEVELHWQCGEHDWRYDIKVEERKGLPVVVEERLDHGLAARKERDVLIETRKNGQRGIVGVGPQGHFVPITEPDRLALGRVGEFERPDSPIGAQLIRSFWERAVFLRLSPNRLAQGSPARRKSFEPILDEEGQSLPALLNELDDEQRRELVAMLSEVLPGIYGVEVSVSDQSRDTWVHYSLLERMPYRGRSGRKRFPIPAWMLSEGTRRITAILALLVRKPRPRVICIEEIENGLDPWTVRAILRHLESAADDGSQIILTTHSPWLLDDVPIESIIQVRRTEGDTQYERFIEREAIKRYAPSVPAGTRYVNELE